MGAFAYLFGAIPVFFDVNAQNEEYLLKKGFVQITSIKEVYSSWGAVRAHQANIRYQQRRLARYHQKRPVQSWPKDPNLPTYSATYRFINRDYTVFQHPDGDWRAIKKTGWNLWAFLFDGLWALVKGLYGRFVLMVCVYLFLAVLVFSGEAAGYEGNFDKMAYFLIFIMKFIYALNATKWVEQKWIRKDYQRKEILQADSRRDAIHRHQKMTEKGASES